METTTTKNQTSAGTDKVSLNPDALNQLLGQMINDLGASVNGALVVLGDKLRIYTALADIGPATSTDHCWTRCRHREQREGSLSRSVSMAVHVIGVRRKPKVS